MFWDDKPGGLSTKILASHSNPDGEVKAEPEPHPDDLTLLAHELMTAIEKKDAYGIQAAFRGMWRHLEATEEPV